MVAAVDKVEAVTAAKVLRRPSLGKHHERIGAARGCPRIGSVHIFPRAHGQVISLHFARPRPGKRREYVIRRIKIKLHAHKTPDLYAFFALVCKPCAPRHHVAVLIDRVAQFKLHIILPVTQRYNKLLCLSCLIVSVRERHVRRISYALRHSFLAARYLFPAIRDTFVCHTCDLVGIIEKIRRHTAVRVHKLHKRLPDIPFPVGRHLKPHILKRKCAVLRVIDIRISGSEHMLFHKRLKLPAV